MVGDEKATRSTAMLRGKLLWQQVSQNKKCLPKEEWKWYHQGYLYNRKTNKVWLSFFFSPPCAHWETSVALHVGLFFSPHIFTSPSLITGMQRRNSPRSQSQSPSFSTSLILLLSSFKYFMLGWHEGQLWFISSQTIVSYIVNILALISVQNAQIA